VGVDVAEPIGDRVEVGDAGNLGNQDAVGLGLAGHTDVIDPPRRIQAVDPDQHLAPAEPAGRDRFADLVAGQRLGVGRDRILEVEDDAIDRQSARLFQCPRVRSRHEQQAAARAGHGSISSGISITTIVWARSGRKADASCPYHRSPWFESLVAVVGIWLEPAHGSIPATPA